MRSVHRASGDPRNCALPQNFFIMKLGKIALFYAVRIKGNKWKPLHSLSKKSQRFLRNDNVVSEDFGRNVFVIILFLV